MSRIPESDVKILWRQTPGKGVEDVAVIPKRQPETPYQGRQLHASSGAVFDGWCDGTDDSLTAAGVFGYMCGKGFEDGVLKKALTEFAKIEEASWARQMLAGITFCAKWRPDSEESV